MAEQERSRGGSAHVAGPLSVEQVAERAADLGITVEQVLEQYRRIAFTSLHDQIFSGFHTYLNWVIQPIGLQRFRPIENVVLMP